MKRGGKTTSERTHMYKRVVDLVIREEKRWEKIVDYITR